MATGSGPRIAVVGGGVIGCAVARELAGCGCRVSLLERNRIAGEASSAAAGILCPQVEAERPSALLNLGTESLRLYSDFAAGIRTETGLDPGYRARGALLLDVTREDEAASDRLHRWQRDAGLAAEPLSAREVCELEPGLGDALRGGIRFSDGAQVDPGLLTRALAVSAQRRGAELREGSPVESLTVTRGRVSGVRLAGGETLETEQVVLSAGAWSSSLVPEVPIRVFPVRGQILVLDSRRPPRRHVLYTRRGYLVPRLDGKVLVGSTMENVGFAKAVTPRAVLKLMATALALDPRLEDACFVSAWSGLRPGTTDGLPLLGEVRPGLVAATGHHRNGILLAPVTAAVIAEWIIRGKTARSLEPFSPLRRPPVGAGRPEPE